MNAILDPLGAHEMLRYAPENNDALVVTLKINKRCGRKAAPKFKVQSPILQYHASHSAVHISKSSRLSPSRMCT